VLDRTATTWLTRLLAWLELFEDSFGHVAQRGALRRYVQGVLSDRSQGRSGVRSRSFEKIEI
jgi:hypothetical protein